MVQFLINNRTLEKNYTGLVSYIFFTEDKDAFEDSPIRDIVFEEGSLLERLLIISETIS